MILPSDPDYLETKLVKQGKHQLAPPLQELAQWMEQHYAGLRVLNIRQERVEIAPYRPRLNIILEFEEDKNRFLRTDKNGNTNPTQEAVIAGQLRKILVSHRDTAFDTEDLLIIYSVFEGAARAEANWKITAAQLDQIRSELQQFEIWEIRSVWERVAFFFHTKRQVQESSANGVRDICIATYWEVLRQYDEYGYFLRRPIEAHFDSKENFDKRYKGNWFNYER